MSAGLKTAGVIAFVAVVLVLALMVFRARSSAQQLAIRRGVTPFNVDEPPTSWNTMDPQDDSDTAQGAHH